MVARKKKRAASPTRKVSAKPLKTSVQKAQQSAPKVVLRQPDWRAILAAARRNRLVHLLVLWSLSCMVQAAYFFSEVLNPSNLVEIFPREFVFPLLLHAVTALFVAGIMHVMPRPRTFGPKAVATVVITLFLVNYDSRLWDVAPVLKAFVPVLPANPMPVISLLVLAIMFGIGIAAGVLLERLKGKYPNVTSTNVLGLACVIVICLFAGQALSVLKASSEIRTESTHAPTAELTQAASMKPETPADKPDIYYIVLDRYTNNTVLKEQFGFDNSPFLDELREQGFSIDDKALSAYPYTAPSVASTLNMSYNNDDVKEFKGNKIQSATLFHSMTEQSQVVKMLQDRGYQYHSIGSTYGTSYRAPLTNFDYACDRRLQLFGKSKCLHGIEALQFQKSIFYRFANVSLKGWPLHYTELDEVDYARNQLNKLHELATGPEQGGRLVFAHILVPHDPFYFLADGSLSAYTRVDQEGMPVKQKYVNQVQFINTQMSQLVSEINQKSNGNAVIMLVSDEGPYPSAMDQTFLNPIDWGGIGDVVDSSDMTKWTKNELAMKFGILQAYHIPAATQDDLKTITPPNAFRVVLNRYFGYDYPYLPNCQMGLPNGREGVYKFKDISELFTGINNPDCKQYE